MKKKEDSKCNIPACANASNAIPSRFPTFGLDGNQGIARINV